MDSLILTFAGFTCHVHLTRYHHGNRIAVRLVDAEDGFPVATASVNLPDEPMAADEVAIKTWSENEGMLEALVDAGIVAPPHRFVSTGHIARVPICRLLLPQSDSPH